MRARRPVALPPPTSPAARARDAAPDATRTLSRRRPARSARDEGDVAVRSTGRARAAGRRRLRARLRPWVGLVRPARLIARRADRRRARRLGWWLLRSPAPRPRPASRRHPRPTAPSSGGDRRPVASADRRRRTVYRGGDSSCTSPGRRRARGVRAARPGRGSTTPSPPPAGATPDADAGRAQPCRALARRRAHRRAGRRARRRRRRRSPSPRRLAAPAGPVDLNRATAAELEALPGHRPGDGVGDRRPPRRRTVLRLDRRPRGGPGIGPAKLDADPRLVTV